VIAGHIAGIPIEEGVLALAPVGAAIATAVAIAGRGTLGRLRRRVRRSPRGELRHERSEITHQRNSAGFPPSLGAWRAPGVSRDDGTGGAVREAPVLERSSLRSCSSGE
jgi:hypothetical protein